MQEILLFILMKIIRRMFSNFRRIFGTLGKEFTSQRRYCKSC